MVPLQPWCRATIVGPDGSRLSRLTLAGPGPPDLGAVDDVARLALEARRRGARLVLDRVCPALGGLLALAGIRVEVEGQAE
jgi:hypothetical protein